MNRLRILILTQYFWPEPFRINEVAESLCELGCDVTILTGQPNYPDGKIYAGYSAWQTGRHRHHGGFDIHRTPIFPRGRGSGARLAANYLSFVLSASPGSVATKSGGDWLCQESPSVVDSWIADQMDLSAGRPSVGAVGGFP